MYQIPSATKASFEQKLDENAIASDERRALRKWIAYYWDFCEKYNQPLSERKSLDAFLTKLAEKKQSIERLHQARKAITIYLGDKSAAQAKACPEPARESSHA